MINEKFIYAEFVENGIQNRNKIYSINEHKIKEPKYDCYRSMFLFDEQYKEYVERVGSTRGYLGNHIADALIFDFDGTDLEEVKKAAINFIWHLYYNFGIPADYTRIAFSGSKGFHVTIPIEAVTTDPQPHPDFWNIYKSICLELSKDFPTDKGIYNRNRIFRIVNTMHSKTGLYKIPLTFNELQKLTIDEIKSLAKGKRTVETLPANEFEPIDTLNELFNNLFHTSQFSDRKKEEEVNKNLFAPAEKGYRNSIAIKLCGILIKNGNDESLSYQILQTWNKQNKPPLAEDELKTLVSGAYRRYFDDKKSKEFKIYNIEEGLKEYHQFAKEPESNKVKIGFEKIDKILRGINRGEVVSIIGKTSVGKSAFLQNVGLNYAKISKKPTMFFSLEMPITSVIERSIQIENQITGYDAERYFKETSPESSRIAHRLLKEIPNFYTVTESGMDLERIKDYVRYAEQNIYKEQTGLVMLDYLGLVRGKGKNIYEEVSKVARELKDTAKELNVPIVFLSQTTKQFDSYTELTLGSARDSGTVDEAADFVLGLWKDRNFIEKEEDKNYEFIHAQLGILKNRRGRLGKIPLTMSKKSLQIAEAEESSLLQQQKNKENNVYPLSNFYEKEELPI